MFMAENKYETLDRTGEWNAPSKEQNEILALNSKWRNTPTRTRLTRKKIKTRESKRLEWKKKTPKDGSNIRERTENLPLLWETRDVDIA